MLVTKKSSPNKFGLQNVGPNKFSAKKCWLTIIFVKQNSGTENIWLNKDNKHLIQKNLCTQNFRQQKFGTRNFGTKYNFIQKEFYSKGEKMISISILPIYFSLKNPFIFSF